MKGMLCRGFCVLFLFVTSSVTPISGRTTAAALTPEAGDGVQPLITTSELVGGQNRFAFGLLQAHQLLDGVGVPVRVSPPAGSGAQFAPRVQAPYPPG